MAFHSRGCVRFVPLRFGNGNHPPDQWSARRLVAVVAVRIERPLGLNEQSRVTRSIVGGRAYRIEVGTRFSHQLVVDQPSRLSGSVGSVQFEPHFGIALPRAGALNKWFFDEAAVESNGRASARRSMIDEQVRNTPPILSRPIAGRFEAGASDSRCGSSVNGQLTQCRIVTGDVGDEQQQGQQQREASRQRHEIPTG